jgi:hypothetical protein
MEEARGEAEELLKINPQWTSRGRKKGGLERSYNNGRMGRGIERSWF